MDEMPAKHELTILPLGSYDLLIGMEWMAWHRTKVDFFSKTIEFPNYSGEIIML